MTLVPIRCAPVTSSFGSFILSYYQSSSPHQLAKIHCRCWFVLQYKMAEKSLPFVNSDALPSPVEYDEDGERILQLQSRRRRLHAVIAFLAMLCLFWTVPKASHHVRSFCSGHHRKPVQEISRDGIAEIQPETKTLVALEAHIMSKCPDARVCVLKISNRRSTDANSMICRIV